MKAQIHGLNVRSKFNGAIVTLEKWDKHHKHFECRLEKTQSVIKVGFNHLKLIEEHGAEVDPRDAMMIGREEEVLYDGSQMYRKTKGGLWRKVDAGGNWLRSDSIRPETLISKVWEQIKRSERKEMNQTQSALIEMEKIIAKHPEIVSDIKDPSLRNRLEKERKAGFKRIARNARAIKEKKREADKLTD